MSGGEIDLPKDFALPPIWNRPFRLGTQTPWWQHKIDSLKVRNESLREKLTKLELEFDTLRLVHNNNIKRMQEEFDTINRFVNRCVYFGAAFTVASLSTYYFFC